MLTHLQTHLSTRHNFSASLLHYIKRVVRNAEKVLVHVELLPCTYLSISHLFQSPLPYHPALPTSPALLYEREWVKLTITKIHMYTPTWTTSASLSQSVSFLYPFDLSLSSLWITTHSTLVYLPNSHTLCPSALVCKHEEQVCVYHSILECVRAMRCARVFACSTMCG